MRRFAASLGFLTACALAGCTGSGFDDGGADDSADQGGGGPAAGEFVTFLAPSGSDGCSLAFSLIAGPDLTQIGVAADGASMTIQGLGSELSCKSTGNDRFSCERRQKLDTDPGADAAASLAFELEWTSSDRIEGKVTTSVSCTGDACASVAKEFPKGLPCSTEGRFLAVRAMPESFAPDIDTTYKATVGTPIFSSCNAAAAPVVAPDQSLRIERVDATTAKVFTDGSDVPLDCTFEGKGRTTCTRIQSDANGVRTLSRVGIAWTGPRTFEGTASAGRDCAEAQSCPDDIIASVPCSSHYQLRGTAAAGAN